MSFASLLFFFSAAFFRASSPPPLRTPPCPSCPSPPSSSSPLLLSSEPPPRFALASLQTVLPYLSCSGRECQAWPLHSWCLWRPVARDLRPVPAARPGSRSSCFGFHAAQAFHCAPNRRHSCPPGPSEPQIGLRTPSCSLSATHVSPESRDVPNRPRSCLG